MLIRWIIHLTSKEYFSELISMSSDLMDLVMHTARKKEKKNYCICADDSEFVNWHAHMN